MPGEVKVVWDDAAVQLWARDDPACQAAMDVTAAALVTAMKAECPVSPVDAFHSSGFLRSSIHALRLPDGSVIAGPTADYAGYVIEGTPPHEIRSKGPWSLHNPATGAYFGPLVHHPGTAPNNFMERAMATMSVVTLGSAA